MLIADVDCTTGGKPLCEKFGVKGYPTIKTFRAGDTDGEVYEGGRDLADLKKHAESLGPTCSVDNRDLCSSEQLLSVHDPPRYRCPLRQMHSGFSFKKCV